MGANSEEEAFLFYTAAKRLMKEGGFNLCKFLSNSRALQNEIEGSNSAPSGSKGEESYAQVTLGNNQTSSGMLEWCGIMILDEII